MRSAAQRLVSSVSTSTASAPRVSLAQVTASHRLVSAAARTTRRTFATRQTREPRRSRAVAIAGGVLAFAATYALLNPSVVRADDGSAPARAGKKGKGRNQLYRLAELREHGADAERVWVSKGDAVYDVTDWLPSHPGGRVMLRAAGGSLEPYWSVFSLHDKPEVYQILEEYRIGSIDPQDLDENGRVPSDEIADPFEHDPERSDRLRILNQKPCNAETPADALESFITPNDVFYVRNHLWVPRVDESDYRLLVTNLDGDEREYSLADLKSRFKPRTITATLQCSGNRRSHMTKNSRSAAGLQWGIGAISNATFEGVLLRDVLIDAGVSETELRRDLHAQFVGAEAYGASIPLTKAMDPRGDCLLAWSMNGEPLPPDHGAPLRVVAPGHVAARSVKWVQSVTVSDEESTSQWQRRDYRLPGPNVSKPDWSRYRSVQETPVQSAITSLRHTSIHTDEARAALRVYGNEEDAIELRGYAFSGGGRAIERVDISVDGGHSWRQATLEPDQDQALGHQSWSWRLWSITIPSHLVGLEICCKAIDESYNVQPERFGPIYNVKGNLGTAWHRIPFDPSSTRS